MNQSDKDAEIEQLKREIRELKEKVQIFESDQNTFKKHKKRFSVNLLTLILKLLADGLNAYQVHKTLMRLYICFILYYFVFPRELISHLWILIPGGLERGVKNNNCNFKWP